MSPIPKTILALAAALLLSACSTFDMARQSCMKQMSNDEMQECLKKNQSAQDEFKRERQTAAKADT